MIWKHSYSTPASYDRQDSRHWGYVLPSRTRLEYNLIVAAHNFFSVPGGIRTRRRKGDITYGTVWLFANERVFESSVWRKICCRGPQRVVGRLKWYLYVRSVVSDRNWSSKPLQGTHTALDESKFPRLGTLPTTKMFCYKIECH